ncbi:hypothetical protein HHI36_004966 [Cryptolaemus montrouzieri]|uniref:Retrotransposon gag domain-containing protein n=1 Tax=Cryptolaemus montrouzieri TaxID=559131 RepID=A0ABD2NT97_9CUCU
MSTVVDSERKIKQKIFRQVLLLEAELDEKVNIPTTPQPLENPVGHSTPSHPANSSQSTYIKKVPIYKWGIKKFAGEESLVNFLELIDSLKFSRGCTDADLFDSAGDLFEHEAWTFWHNGHIKQRFTDWQGLVSMLKKSFLHDNYDQVLLNEIESRKQSAKEAVCIFIASQKAQV